MRRNSSRTAYTVLGLGNHWKIRYAETDEGTRVRVMYRLCWVEQSGVTRWAYVRDDACEG